VASVLFGGFLEVAFHRARLLASLELDLARIACEQGLGVGLACLGGVASASDRNLVRVHRCELRHLSPVQLLHSSRSRGPVLMWRSEENTGDALDNREVRPKGKP
jgi:hypothetical protein